VPVQDEEGLIRRARRGDPEAFMKLVGPHVAHIILNRARRKTGSLVEGQDVRQETFLRAYGSISRFSGSNRSTFFAWLHGIARNVTLETNREKRGYVQLAAGAGPLDERPTPFEALRAGEILERINKVVDAFEPEDRLMFRLKYFEGLSNAEIAGFLGRGDTEGTVRSRIFRLTHKLRSELKKAGLGLE